jgi:hypothetical protein
MSNSIVGFALIYMVVFCQLIKIIIGAPMSFGKNIFCTVSNSCCLNHHWDIKQKITLNINRK